MASTDGKRTLRFGVLCDTFELWAWQVECLEGLRQVGGCVPVVAVLNAAPRPRPGPLGRLIRSLAGGRLGWSVFDRLVASRASPATCRTPAPDWLLDLERMECAIVMRGRHSEYFTDEDVERLRALKLDFLIKLGFGITRGAILDVARYGVWSFHHGDEARYRGAPPCFWEIYHGDPVTGSILQRLTDKLDGGVILKRGYFQTIFHSYAANRDRAFAASTGWPAQVCRDIQNGAADYLADPPTSSSAPIYRYPGTAQMAVFVLRVARNWLKRQLEELLFCDMWNVGVVDEPIEAIVRRGSVGPIRWMDPPGGDRYFADPCGVRLGSETWILAEDYSYKGDHGVLAARRLSDGTGHGAWRTILDAPWHLSFPQAFEHKGRIYCLPECAQSGEIALYSAESFPDRWAKVATLVADFPGVDSTLFSSEGRWWLFCTDLERGDGSHLHVFHADALTGPYTPHDNNPVKIDIRGSRPAGPLFSLDGVWVRPAQNGSRTYGHSITLNRILRLTPQAFEEVPILELLPDPNGRYPHGLHTIHGIGDITLVDGKRQSFVPGVFLRRAMAKAAKLIPSRLNRKINSSVAGVPKH